VRRTLGRTTIVLVVVTLFTYPFVQMVLTSLTPPDQILSDSHGTLDHGWTLENFKAALHAMPIARYFANTVFVSAMTVLGTVISCPLVAYSLSKVEWWGSKPLLLVVLATMMLPPQVTMIPVFLIWNRLGLTDGYVPLIMPAFLGTPFLIFMIRQFLMQVPDDLLDAARLDGASEWRIYWSIALPLIRPAVITAGVFQFVWTWTDFLGPLIYLNDESKYTLSVGLYSFFGQHDVAWGPLMAACVMFTVPAVIVFLLAQRYFVAGLNTGALK
jgi:multiple sugar transport system permease protein